MYYLSIQTAISAAHFLNQYEGDCARLHGHNWKLEVSVKGDKLDETGMVIDFKDLHELCWQVAGKFDHQVINEVAPFDKMNPTAEHLAKFFYNEIGKLLPADVYMHEISLWETEKYKVVYCE